MSTYKLILNLLIISSLCSCGSSGGSSNDGVVFEGTLVQGAGTTDRLAHEAGEKIGGVSICALGECSTTDDNGQWGFRVEQASTEILFSANGHGIENSWTINIPTGAKDVFIELENHEDGVHAHSILADGKAVEQHNHNSEEHTHNE